RPLKWTRQLLKSFLCTPPALKTANSVPGIGVSSASRRLAPALSPAVTAAVSSHPDCRVRYRKAVSFAHLHPPLSAFHLECKSSHEFPHKTAARRPADYFCVGLSRGLCRHLLHECVLRGHGHAAHRSARVAIQEGICSERGGAFSPGQKYCRRW